MLGRMTISTPREPKGSKLPSMQFGASFFGGETVGCVSLAPFGVVTGRGFYFVRAASKATPFSDGSACRRKLERGARPGNLGGWR